PRGPEPGRAGRHLVLAGPLVAGSRTWCGAAGPRRRDPAAGRGMGRGRGGPAHTDRRGVDPAVRAACPRSRADGRCVVSVGTPTPPAPPPSAPPSTPSPGPGSGSRRGPVLTVHGVVAPLAAALAVIAAATALSGVVQGWAWFGDVLVATLLIAATGIGTRAVRLHPFLVGAAQLLVLLMVVTGSFTTTGVLGVLPGPEAFGELHRVLLSGFEDIRTGLPPVEASHGIRCLIMITLGLVALVVDVLAVTAAAPAARS